MTYESTRQVPCQAFPEVSFTVARMSFGRRLELMRSIRDLARRMEFLEAGTEPRERMEAALLQAEIDRAYVGWGLTEIHGLELDGIPATPQSLAEAGPEAVFREALAAVKAEIELSEAERKN